MKRFALFLIIILGNFASNAQQLSLDDCKKLALDHNYSIRIAAEQVGATSALVKSARTKFLPSFNANGMYTRTNKKFQLLQSDAFLPVVPFAAIDQNSGGLNNTILSPTLPNGSPNPFFDPQVFANTFALNPLTGQPITDNNGNPVFNNYSWIPKDQFEFGQKNVFMGGITLTQPIYAGGKIRETYNMAKYGNAIAQANHKMEQSEILYKTEEAYWRMVTLQEKIRMVRTYIQLLEKLSADLENLHAEGIIIRNELLRVQVKTNEAKYNLIKAQNGLTLSRMALCQITGLSLSSSIVLTDSLTNDIEPLPLFAFADSALAKRMELAALEQTVNLAQSGVKLMRSRYLPDMGLVANYMTLNPNPYNGFAKEFGADWSVGIAINIPIFHWNDKAHTLRAAKHELTAAQLKLAETQELISLQVQQSVFLVGETSKKVDMANANLTLAEENLRVVTNSFNVGMAKTTDLLEAQALWQSAWSDLIDARMEQRLSYTNLKKASGILR